MNQTCKVCGEPAAGFHFGAFTCEGCKSFFGRSYNNMNAVSECKNNNNCVINKKNRTACKSCRLRKCLHVGMSKSGSRYGRRSNWFKIHCLIQEQQQQHQQSNQLQPGARIFQKTPPPPPQPPMGLGLQSYVHPILHHITRTKEELRLLGLDDYKNSASPCVSSPESHNSDSSIELSDARRIPMFPGFLPAAFLPPPGLLMAPGYPPIYSTLLNSANNNNNRLVTTTHNPGTDALNKRIYLDAILNSQRVSTPEVTPPTLSPSPVQEDPIDLSMKTLSERGSSPSNSDRLSSEGTDHCHGSEGDGESDCDSENELKSVDLVRRTPLDLTTKV